MYSKKSKNLTWKYTKCSIQISTNLCIISKIVHCASDSSMTWTDIIKEVNSIEIMEVGSLLGILKHSSKPMLINSRSHYHSIWWTDNLEVIILFLSCWNGFFFHEISIPYISFSNIMNNYSFNLPQFSCKLTSGSWKYN